jgi:hypothetical protein
MPEDQIIEGMKRMGDVLHCELNKETIPFEWERGHIIKKFYFI